MMTATKKAGVTHLRSVIAHHALRALLVGHPVHVDVERRRQRVEARERPREENDDVAEQARA